MGIDGIDILRATDSDSEPPPRDLSGGNDAATAPGERIAKELSSGWWNARGRVTEHRLDLAADPAESRNLGAKESADLARLWKKPRVWEDSVKSDW